MTKCLLGKAGISEKVAAQGASYLRKPPLTSTRPNGHTSAIGVDAGLFILVRHLFPRLFPLPERRSGPVCSCH